MVARIYLGTSIKSKTSTKGRSESSNDYRYVCYVEAYVISQYMSYILIDAGGSADPDEGEAFCLGLIEICPKCGESGMEIPEMIDATQKAISTKMRDGNTIYSIRKKHLAHCTDVRLHRAYEKRKQKEELNQSRKNAKLQSQEEVQQLAAWEFLGSNTTQLWLLEESNLRKKAKEYGITSGSKAELMEQIIECQVSGKIISLMYSI